jgi:hypothetical protein
MLEIMQPYSLRARVALSFACGVLSTAASAGAQMPPQTATVAGTESPPSSPTDPLEVTPPEAASPESPASELPAPQAPPAEPSQPPVSEASPAEPAEPSQPPVSEASPAEPAETETPPASPSQPALLPTDIVALSALPLHALAAGALLSEAELWARLEESPATCFGEVHDDPYQHYAQARALEELGARAAASARPLAVGFEMFQRPFQSSLSAFVEGELDEAGLLAGTEYATISPSIARCSRARASSGYRRWR